METAATVLTLGILAFSMWDFIGDIFGIGDTFAVDPAAEGAADAIEVLRQSSSGRAALGGDWVVDKVRGDLQEESTLELRLRGVVYVVGNDEPSKRGKLSFEYVRIGAMRQVSAKLEIDGQTIAL